MKPASNIPPASLSVQDRQLLREYLLVLPYPAFEKVIQTLIERSGYVPVSKTDRNYKRGRTKTGGLDIRAYAGTDLAPSLTLVQIKQYERVVSRRFVDELRGAILRYGAEQGLLITTSTFSRVAHHAAASVGIAPIRLIEGDEILDMMVQYRVGVKAGRRGSLQIDTEFFDNLLKRSSTGAANRKAKSSTVVDQPATDASECHPHCHDCETATSVNRATCGALGGEMQWKTHILIGVNTLWLFELIPHTLLREQVPAMLAAAAIGSLLPDLDATQSKIKHLSVWGIRPFFLPAIAINRALGHRGFLHSAAALILVGLASVPVSTSYGWQTGAALTLGYGAHLAADACTTMGIPLKYVPWFNTDKRRYHLLPPKLRFVTGSDAELALIPFLGLLILLLLLRHLAPGDVPPLVVR